MSTDKLKVGTYRYTKDNFDIKKAPTWVADSVPQLKEIRKTIGKNVKRIKSAQKMMYAQRKYGMLIVLQAMDAAGKDSMISHIFAGVNPVGFQVANFKQPTSMDLRHDYLWRINKKLPLRGDIGVFNRSYYEDVLVSRVHPQIILNANLPEKRWKFSSSDIKERRYWDKYQKAYEKAINATATKENPWYVIPADDKWYSRLIVSDLLTKLIEDMPLAYPTLDPAEAARLDEAKQTLMNEK